MKAWLNKYGKGEGAISNCGQDEGESGEDGYGAWRGLLRSYLRLSKGLNCIKSDASHPIPFTLFHSTCDEMDQSGSRPAKVN